MLTPMRSESDTNTSEQHALHTKDSKSRPVPKPRTASTSSTLDTAGGFADLGATHVKSSNPSLDRSVESDVMRPRPRARGSQEDLSRPQHAPRSRGSQEALDKPQPQQRARTRGSQESLDKSLDDGRRAVPRANPHGSVDSMDRVMDQRPTPALRGSQESLDRLRGSQESLDRLGRPQPRARASLDRSLDESEKPNRPPVAIKASKKPATTRNDRAISSDETDV